MIKYMKFTTCLFIMTAIISTFAVNARTKGFAQVTIPAWQGQKTVGENIEKDYWGPQKFEKTTCKDKLSGNEMAIEVQTYSRIERNYTPYVDAPKNQLRTISEDMHLSPVAYDLNAKAKNSFITEGSLYGTWVLG